MNTWNTTSTNSPFGSTGVGPGIEGSSSTGSYSRQSPSTPSRTNPWSSVLLSTWRPTTTCWGYLSEVNTHLEKFFDRVNHDKLMGQIAKRIEDKRLLQLIRAFLNAVVMENGVRSPSVEGP